MEEIGGHFPARVKAEGTGCKSEKKKRSDCSLFLGLCHVFSSHPSCFLLPGASWRHLPGYFSRRKQSQANPPQWDWWVEGKGRGGQERGGRHTWEVGSGEKSGDRGVQGRRPRRPVSPQPCLPESWAPSLQTGYQPPGVCPRICSHSVMHDLCKVQTPWSCTMTPDPYI